MARYGKKAQEKVEETMRERKQGRLRSGSGAKVTSRKQAIAIGLSEARKEGGKVPAKKSSGTAAKKSTGRKTAASKSARGATTSRKTAAKKTRTTTARKTAARKGAAKSAARKTPSRKTATRKSA